MKRQLPVPPEPLDAKERILAVRARLGPGRDVDWDPLAVWFGNRIPSYLWRRWKAELTKEGFTWQRFLRLMKYRTDDLILWANGTLPWESFVRRVIDSLEGPLGEVVKR